METTNVSVSRFLKTRLEKLQEKNKSYSMRAFAAKIGLSPGGLTQILSGKKKLSAERAHLIADHLQLSKEQKKVFLLSVEFEQAKSEDRKAEVLEGLRSLRTREAPAFFDLSVEQFRLISEWHGLAAFECLSTYGKKFSARDLARHFGITFVEASLVLDRLQRLELIEEDKKGGWKRVRDRLFVTSVIPNDSLRKHYLSVTEKSIASYREQSPQEKVCGTEVFAFDVTQLEEVRKMTDEYLNNLQALAVSGKKPKDTYQAIVNVFRLNKKGEN
jgi:uncharacterized protein (TIGR02147 family)